MRVALAVPPKLHEQLSEWAEAEGRPVASLCMYLIEQALRQAQREGIAPSPYKKPAEQLGLDEDVLKKYLGNATAAKLMRQAQELGYESVEEMEEHTGPSVVDLSADTINTVKGRFIKGPKNVDRADYQAVIEEAKQGKYIKPKDEMTKKERIITALSEALFE